MQAKNKKNIQNRQLFSERFRSIRAQLRLSQRDLAQKIGLTGNVQVSKFENSVSEPSLEALRKLAELQSIDVEIDLHELITGLPSPAAKKWKEEYFTILELTAKYILRETDRLLVERHKLWGELGEAQAKEVNHPDSQTKYIGHLEAEVHRVEQHIADVTEDQRYIQEALLHKQV